MIQVNGDPLPWTRDLTIRGVLKAKNYKFRMLVISIDGVQVKPADYDTTPVPDGAVVQVIHLISGG